MLDELLEYIQKTNPEMTRKKLVEELGRTDSSTKSIIREFILIYPENQILSSLVFLYTVTIFELCDMIIKSFLKEEITI